MALDYKAGDSVKQKVKIISGNVVGPEIVDGDVQYRVSYVGEDGEPHERLFKADEIEKAE